MLKKSLTRKLRKSKSRRKVTKPRKSKSTRKVRNSKSTRKPRKSKSTRKVTKPRKSRRRILDFGGIFGKYEDEEEFNEVEFWREKITNFDDILKELLIAKNSYDIGRIEKSLARYLTQNSQSFRGNKIRIYNLNGQLNLTFKQILESI